MPKETYDLPVFEGVEDYSTEYLRLFITYCRENNAYYYAKPKDEFNIIEARIEAIRAHADILILDNMS